MLKKIAPIVLVLLLAALSPAQEQFQIATPTFFNPLYFKQAFTRPVKYTLEAPGSLRDLVRDGKLSLSVNDVARLVVQRNTEVWLARLDVQSSKTAVIRAAAPFDPRFRGSFSSTRAISPTYSALDASTQLTQQADFSYQQLFASGTGYSVGFSGFKTASNNAFATLNPALRAGLSVGLSQPLLRDRGFFIQKAPIVIARINEQSAQRNFEQKLTDLLQLALNQYWDVIQARESLAVLRNSLALAEKSYARDKRALELGALPPLDIYRSEAEVATRRVQVTTAEYQLKQQEDTLRRIIAADLDPDVRQLPLELTESPTPGMMLSEPKAEEAIAQAIRSRPELDMLRRQQAIDEVNVRVAINSLKPDLRLGGSYASNGLGGHGVVDGIRVPGGFGDALSQLFDFNNPTYGFSLSLNFPIKSRLAQAEYASAEITRRKNVYQERNLEQQISLEVRNAISRLEQSKANIEGATKARDLAQKNLEAEQRKYELGAQTIFFVLEAQQRASDAQRQLLDASIAYRKALIALQRYTASLLEENQIVVEKALAAK